MSPAVALVLAWLFLALGIVGIPAAALGWWAGRRALGAALDPARLEPVPPDVRVFSLTPPGLPGWHAPTPPALPRAGRLTWHGAQDQHYELARYVGERDPFPTHPEPIYSSAELDEWAASWAARFDRQRAEWARR